MLDDFLLKLQTSLKWLTVAMPLLEISKRQDQSETSVRLEELERYGDMEDGLSQSNKIAGESQRELETREKARENYRELERELEIVRDSQRQLERARQSQRELERAREIWRYGEWPIIV